CWLDRMGEPEARAHPDLAGQTDFAAHEFDQPLTDGQAEAGAAVAAGGRGIGLREAFEQLLLQLLRDAGTRVGDTDLEGTQARLADVEMDAAEFGELDGI